VRILHQLAFSFFKQPGHFPFLYCLHSPQYKPQKDVSFEFDVMFCLFLLKEAELAEAVGLLYEDL